MDPELCNKFSIVIEHYPDELNNSEKSNIHDIADIRNYCPKGASEYNTCITELDKINAACLWLFNKNIAYRYDELSSEQFKAFIIYIMIWLNYMLNLKKSETNLSDFYANIEKNENYTNCKRHSKDCNSTLKEKTEYNNFKDAIVKNMDLLKIDIKDISKFYDAFKLLCKIPTEYDDNLECTKYLEYANEIVDKFKKLNESSSVTGNNSYSQIWSTLSTDYENFKKKYNNAKCVGIPLLPPMKTTQHDVQSSDVTSSSLSIVKKLILALSIFSAITIFLGIFYKCSLFVLRKRAQKQHLREKLKNIKKRMNH
ncbi:PIR protein [Plasmodium yoelii]|uniref:PIR protein n=2 Tax=Plasmodium yoelii TaxID=5861 RepID=A0AAE9X3J0_PLAYO|nr:PIR protein [Plasmodium yoelii]WBY61384.1 PIR protein [Plasmodium yoelii yoelii]VTZ82038.1 PIR protein [Plasmodium yoelii]|eukprot:XP_022810819.1 PIR protein [Plasmodium yoelii]